MRGVIKMKYKTLLCICLIIFGLSTARNRKKTMITITINQSAQSQDKMSECAQVLVVVGGLSLLIV
jgi:hypothetical protein